MRKTLLIAGSILAVAGSAFAEVQTNNFRSLSLQQCIHSALANNFDVQIERYAPRFSELDYETRVANYYVPVFANEVRHSYSLTEGGGINDQGQAILSTANENTTFTPDISGTLPTGLTYDFGQNIRHRTGMGSKGPFDNFDSTTGVTLAQPLLRNFWIDANRRDIWIARKQIKVSEEAYRQQLMDTATRVERAYYELIFAREEIKVQETAIELADRFLKESRRRVEVGSMAPLDVKQAESQYARSKSDLFAAQQNLLLRENDLKNLMLSNFREWYNVTILPTEKLLAVPEKFDLQESWRVGVTQRPELQQLRLELEKRDIEVKYRWNQMFPRLDVTGSYGRNGLADDFGGILDDTRKGNNPTYSVGAIFSIPLSLRGPRSAYNASRIDKETALLKYKKEEQDILVGIQNAISNAENSYERFKAAAEATSFAEASLQAEQKKLESGKSTSLAVLIIQRDLTERRSDEIRALADYNQALADISFQEGTTLDRNHFAVTFK